MARRMTMVIAAAAVALAADRLAAAPVARPSAAVQGPRTPYPGGLWEPGPARFGVTVRDDVPIRMDDGVVLRASVAWPTERTTGRLAKGRFPVVVEHTPYVRLGQPVVPNPFFTERGYIYVVVRARGTGASGGEIAFWSPRDALDGKAVVDWAARRLQGSDGRIALHGCSYPGGLVLGDAAAVGPRSPVKVAVAACVGFSSQQRQVWQVNGLPTASLHNFPLRTATLMGPAPSVARGFAKLRDGIMSGSEMAYEGPFWRERDRVEQSRAIVANGIPVLLWSGWGDIQETGALRTYAALQNAYAGRPLHGPMTPGQPVTPRYQIILGGWDHAAGLDAGIFLQWIETWLKGVDTGIRRTATPMHLFVSRANRWINAAGWPIAQRYERWYFGAGGRLTTALPRAAGQATLRWAEPDEPDGRLRLTTAPLTQGGILAGPIGVTVHASTSITNLALIGRLFDVAPDGRATLISKGALVGSQSALDPERSWADRFGTIGWPWPRLDRDVYLRPGRVGRFELSLAPRLYGVAPGHRLRLELTTRTPAAICPATGMTPATGSDPCRLTAPQQRTIPGGIYSIRFSPALPSSLNLPLLPWTHLPAVAAGTPPTGWIENQRRLRDPTRGDPLFSLPLDWGG